MSFDWSWGNSQSRKYWRNIHGVAEYYTVKFQLIGMIAKLCKVLWVQKITIAPLKNRLSLNFYTMEYRKCGNSNSKNDSRLCMGASAFLKSVDFTGFAVNVKTIAPKKYLYQFGHAIWLAYHNLIQCTQAESGCIF